MGISHPQKHHRNTSPGPVKPQNSQQDTPTCTTEKEDEHPSTSVLGRWPNMAGPSQVKGPGNTKPFPPTQNKVSELNGPKCRQLL